MFSFKSLGHFFASAAHDIKVGVTFLQNHQTQIDGVLQTGAAVVSIADPAFAPLATEIERAGEAALGEIFAVVSKISDAEAAHGVNISLDAAAIAEFKALFAAISQIKPSAMIPPASLTAPEAVK